MKRLDLRMIIIVTAFTLLTSPLSTFASHYNHHRELVVVYSLPEKYRLLSKEIPKVKLEYQEELNLLEKLKEEKENNREQILLMSKIHEKSGEKIRFKNKEISKEKLGKAVVKRIDYEETINRRIANSEKNLAFLELILNEIRTTIKAYSKVKLLRKSLGYYYFQKLMESGKIYDFSYLDSMPGEPKNSRHKILSGIKISPIPSLPDPDPDNPCTFSREEPECIEITEKDGLMTLERLEVSILWLFDRQIKRLNLNQKPY